MLINKLNRKVELKKKKSHLLKLKLGFIWGILKRPFYKVFFN